MHLVKFGTTGRIDQTAYIHPSECLVVDDQCKIPANATGYGFVLNGKVKVNGRSVLEDEYFVAKSGSVVVAAGVVALFIRYGFRGQVIMGGVIERQGRVQEGANPPYTDLILRHSPGDPRLFSVYLPRSEKQPMRSHLAPTMGLVVDGLVSLATLQESHTLSVGDVFGFESGEQHRFNTGETPVSLLMFAAI